MNRAKLYLDTSSLINFSDTNRIHPDRIKNQYDVFLSLLNYFEIVVYEDDSKKIHLLNYFKEFKDHLPLDLPTSIVTRFLSDIANKSNQTRWSIEGHEYPDWDDENNILLISNNLKKEKEHFIITNTNARTFLKKNNIKSNNPTVHDSILYLNYIFNQNDMLEGIFDDISNIGPKLVFSTQLKVDLMKSLPLICYFVPWLLGHHRLAMKNSHFSPKKNPNSIDIAHSFYMGACDVFVTDDERLHSLLDDLNKFEFFNFYNKVKILDSNQFLNSV